ncbi:hypothetical protein O2K51_09655 [Apibacter raozihei]|uniref:hypothetical protein n=1 Tax=Apibacter raozihei TaxID=2500547 RepID=UPI000FE38EE2|nr:hypothetical protein [Apibacter raozihei]
MRIIYTAIVFCFLLLPVTCTDNKQNSVKNNNDDTEQDSLVITNKDEVSKDISLDPVTKSVPKFEDAQVNKFVDATKKYFEEVARANKEGNTDKIIELQLRANDIDAELQKVKKRLTVQQQKQLEDWYMMLVTAASK